MKLTRKLVDCTPDVVKFLGHYCR